MSVFIVPTSWLELIDHAGRTVDHGESLCARTSRSAAVFCVQGLRSQCFTLKLLRQIGYLRLAHIVKDNYFPLVPLRTPPVIQRLFPESSVLGCIASNSAFVSHIVPTAWKDFGGGLKHTRPDQERLARHELRPRS